MRIEPLHADFGAQIFDLDLSHDPQPDEIHQLRNALDEYQLLLFRNRKLIEPDRQIAIAAWFGTPADDGVGNLWSVLRNEDAAGSIKLPFHADFTYTDSPIKIITLHATEVPEGGTSTSFVSGVYGWETLPQDLKDQLSSATLRHKHVSKISIDMPEFVAEHPVRKIHPRTGRPILFVTEHHADRILELDAANSQAALDRIFAHLYAEERIYTHDWQLHDLVIWDNLAVQHARREVAALAAGRRAVQRVIINDVTFSELIERARRQSVPQQESA